MTGVLDFGIGNIASILNMIECVHGKGMAVHTAEELALCKRLILPGVGAFDTGMSLLNLSGMRDALDKAVANGIPLLGICLGMQMLGLSSEEVPLAGSFAQNSSHGLEQCKPEQSRSSADCRLRSGCTVLFCS